MVIGTYSISSPYGNFLVWPNDIVGDTMAKGEFWDSFLLPEFDAIVPGKTIIDIGANIGIFSVYAAKRGCKVYAFEASPDNFSALVENIRLNGLEDSVVAYNVALLDTEIELQVVEKTRSEHGGFAVIPSSENVFCKSKTLDSFGIIDVALIKVDAQGCDLKIMKGGENTIRKWKPVLCYEIEGTALSLHNESEADYIEFMDSIEYKIKFVHDGYGSWDYVAKPKKHKGEVTYE